MISRKRVVRLLALIVAIATMPALAEGSGHGDPAAPVILALAVILVAAKLGGDLATRLEQPAVLGELMVGVVLGNVSLLGLTVFEPIASNAFIDMFSRVGVIILLFEVGLESTVNQMMKVGVSALLVACIGVVVPFVLGYFVTRALLPASSPYVALFIGATLTATSVGITARVLKDLEKSQTQEARIVLGAAVIDDVLGLVILAVVTGVISAADQGKELALSEVVITLSKAVGFLVGSLVLGVWLSPRLFRLASLLRARMVLLAFGLGFCFTLAWLADFIGLAPIVGAFAAGLILEDVHFKDFKEKEPQTLEELVHPISYFLVPVFFVLMGMRTDLHSFVAPGVLWLAAALCVVAVAGKLVAGLGARGTGLDRLSIGVGMVPRGEVGLIFASIGSQLTVKGERVVDANIFSAVVVMVIVTTMVTPPVLKWSLNRR
ncbi:MAG: cation:proton antiporter [Archangium sp.]|nr:cation:proton antiporter [Archangium sp.]MDP3570231.1 cation:proton antiporter [Archangium sp.]